MSACSSQLRAWFVPCCALVAVVVACGGANEKTLFDVGRGGSGGGDGDGGGQSGAGGGSAGKGGSAEQGGAGSASGGTAGKGASGGAGMAGQGGGGAGGKGGGVECADGVDNDADGFSDDDDPGCTFESDDDERVFAPTCAEAEIEVIDITLEDTSLDVLVSGSTDGRDDLLEPSDDSNNCPAASSGEQVYVYRAFETLEDVVFSTNNPGTDYDTVLYVRRGSCGIGAPEMCNDDHDDQPSAPSTVTFATMQPGDYFIIVDGWDGDAGNFELSIDLPN